MVMKTVAVASTPDGHLTHKSAKTGRYASEEENGEDMGQIFVLMVW
jgi:hypothetical protein